MPSTALSITVLALTANGKKGATSGVVAAYSLPGVGLDEQHPIVSKSLYLGDLELNTAQQPQTGTVLEGRAQLETIQT